MQESTLFCISRTFQDHSINKMLKKIIFSELMFSDKSKTFVFFIADVIRDFKEPYF